MENTKALMKVQHAIHDANISLALFTTTSQNVSELRKNVMKGEFAATLLKPSLVIDSFPLLVAANKAVHFNKCSTMTTKNVHSEILFCLSPSKNISESFKTFGISESDTSVLVLIVDDVDDNTLYRVSQILQAEPVSIDQLKDLSDKELITKTYKLTPEELTTYSVSDAVTARISAKEIYSGKQVKI